MGRAPVCQPEAEVFFTETLRLLERISDNAGNLDCLTDTLSRLLCGILALPFSLLFECVTRQPTT